MTNTETLTKERPSLSDANGSPNEDGFIPEELKEIEHELAESHPEVVEIIDNMPTKDRNLVLSMMTKQESFSGPLPHPSHLKGYAEVYKDAPEKIFKMTEEQQIHRQSLENRNMSLEELTRKRILGQQSAGMYLGFSLALIFLFGGFTCILMDKEGIGITVLAGVIIGLVALFISQRPNKNSPPEASIEEDE